jgi:hypothetical protein
LIPASATSALRLRARRRPAGRRLPPAPIEGLPRIPKSERARREIPPAFILLYRAKVARGHSARRNSTGAVPFGVHAVSQRAAETASVGLP